MLQALRATGRTTRLIAEAKRLHEQGKPVVIVVATNDQAKQVRRQTDNKIPVLHSHSRDWDWTQMRQDGQPLETEYLIDHYAIEERYANVLRELHRFDPPIVTSRYG